MAIYVDADACPVKAEAERVADRTDQMLYLVANGGLRLSDNPRVQVVFVDQGADIADKWIADRAGPGDVVVTADIPLAAKVIAAGARVVQHNGEVLGQANIGGRLAARDLMADLRAADPFAQGSGKAFSRADRARFLDALDRELRKALKDMDK